MSPKEGSTVLVHELYHCFHWSFGVFEERDAWDLQTQVYIELGLPKSGALWDDLIDASIKYDFLLP